MRKSCDRFFAQRRRCEAALRSLSSFHSLNVECPGCPIGKCRIAGVSPRRQVLNLICPGGFLRSICYRGLARFAFRDAGLDLCDGRGKLLFSVNLAAKDWESFLAAQALASSTEVMRSAA